MKVIDQYYRIESPLDRETILKAIETAGRTCYKSEDKITADSASKFVKAIIKRGHESVIEHVSLSVRFVTDRGVTHELVRHRLAAYSQESTRYCNYGKNSRVVFIRPVWVPAYFEGDWPLNECFTSQFIDADLASKIWFDACGYAAWKYLELLRRGWRPEQARAVLPNSLKTEIVMTANLREWRHVLKLRTAPSAHPQIRELMRPLLRELKEALPEIFGDINRETE